MAERSFIDAEHHGPDDTKLDPHVQRDRLFKLYETAKADQQANYPDLYVSTGAAAAKGGQEVVRQVEDAAKKELEDAKAQAAKVQADIMAKIEDLVARVEGRIREKVESAAGGVSGKVGG